MKPAPALCAAVLLCPIATTLAAEPTPEEARAIAKEACVDVPRPEVLDRKWTAPLLNRVRE